MNIISNHHTFIFIYNKRKMAKMRLSLRLGQSITSKVKKTNIFNLVYYYLFTNIAILCPGKINRNKIFIQTYRQIELYIE